MICLSLFFPRNFSVKEELASTMMSEYALSSILSLKRGASTEASAAAERKKSKGVATPLGDLCEEEISGGDPAPNSTLDERSSLNISNELLSCEPMMTCGEENSIADIGGDSEMQVEIPLAPVLSYAEEVSMMVDTVIQVIIGLDAVIDMASILDKQPHVRQLVGDIFQSLKLVGKDGEQVAATLGAQVRKLFGSSEFIKACVDTHEEDPMLLAHIKAFSLDANDQVRLEYLKRDAFFGFFLAAKQDFFCMREVLAIILGYWSDQSLYLKLIDEIKKAGVELQRVDVIIADDVDYPCTVQGFKDMLKDNYTEDVYEKICEKNDLDKLSRKVCGLSQSEIKWLWIEWLDENTIDVQITGYWEYPYFVPSN